ncbi:MAG: phenylacetate--CoA ligase family protein [Anaerolineae bacterium]
MSLTDRLKQTIAHGYANAPALRRLMDEAGLTPADIQSVADLPKIPVTTKDQLAQMQKDNPPFGGWLAVPLEGLQRIYISPGPLFEPGGEETLDEARLEAFRAAGLGPGDVVLNTFLYHLVPAGLMLDAALRGIGATVVPTGPGNTDYQVQIMMALGATGYVGTPSFLKVIFQKAEAMGIPRQAIPIKKGFFSAEPYPPSLRAFFEEDYGMTTSQSYATAELGVIAFDRTGETTLKLVRNLIVEIVDPESGQPVPPGEPGHVVVTTFDKTYPLVRLGTGDLSAFVGQPDAEGYYTHIKGWMGRVGDAIKVRGMFLHPLQLKAAIAQFEELGNVQAIVTRPDTRDHVRLRVEMKNGTADEEALREKVKAAASQACRLKVDEVEFVAAGSIEESARTVVDERTWE